jgi:hypothetical protein
MANTFDEYLDRYGRPDDPYPVIDLDTADQRRTVIVTFAGGAKKAIVQFIGLAAGTDNEHLCIDVHAFVDDMAARSSVFGMENGRRYPGFDQTAPGRSHGAPAARLLAVLIGAQTAAAEPGRISSAFDADDLDALVITAADAVGAGIETLSSRQQQLAMRAYQLLHEALDG